MLKSDPASPSQNAFSDSSLDQVLEVLSQRSDLDRHPSEFFEFLSKTLVSLSITRIEIWTCNPQKVLSLAWPTDTVNAHDVDPNIVQAVIDSDLPRIIHPSANQPKSPDNNDESTPRHNLLIVSPWHGIDSHRGAIVFSASDGAPATVPQHYLPVAAAVGEIVARFQTRQTLLRLEESLNQQRRIDSFVLRLNSCVGFQQVAYAIANDGRQLIACDRLSVVVRSADRWKVAAISGAEHVHRHSPSARSLQAFCGRVAATGNPLWQDTPADDLPPQITDSMAEYLDHSPASSISVIPLQVPALDDQSIGQVIGAIVVEDYKLGHTHLDKGSILNIAQHCSIALHNAATMDRVPGIRLGMWIANFRWSEYFGARTIIGVAIGILLFLCLAYIPADIRIRAHGEIMPTVCRDVFAPRDAVITNVLIEHGQWVDAGQPLIELRSTDLELEIQLVDGELHQARKRLSVTQSERLQLPPGDADARNKQRRLTADEEQYQQQVLSLEARQAILRQHQKQLVVVSPIAGQVLTWNTQERLATRPVQKGETLLSVADTSGAWQAELQVPGRHAGRILNARRDLKPGSREPATDVLLASSTAPGTWIDATISHLSSRVQADSSGNAHLTAIASFTDDQASRIPLVPGATTVARIGCGRGSLAESIFFELTDAVRLWIPF